MDEQRTIASSSGQSAMASEPSFMFSVMMLGWAMAPASRWSRLKAIGAVNSPLRTSSLPASASWVRSPWPSQAMRADGAGEQRPEIGFGENLDVEGVLHPAVPGLGADQIAVVENLGAGLLE